MNFGYFGYVLIFLVGLAIGSFLNAVVYRLPRGENFINARSKCPHCSHSLQWFDLIPIISFLTLRGRCRYCGKPISLRYPLVELAGGVLLLAPFLLGHGISYPELILKAVMLELFLALLIFDLSYLILPDPILIIMVIIGAGYFLLAKFIGLSNGFSADNLIGAATLTIFLGAIWFFSRGKWLGFGDVKLGFVVGFLFGFYPSILILYVAVIIGGLIAAALLVTRKATLKTQIPLGSFISLAAIAYMIFGQQAHYIINAFKILWS